MPSVRCTDADEIRHLLDETSAACACITVKGSPSFGGLYDVGASLDRADRGGCLSPEELLRIAAVLKCARQTKAYSEGEGEARRSRACWMCTSSRSRTNKYLEERIFTSILSKDEIADAASSELASIRRKIRQQSAKIRESLQKIITSPSYAKISAGADRDHPLRPLRRPGQGRVQEPASGPRARCLVLRQHVFHRADVRRQRQQRAARAVHGARRKEIERILAELSAEAAAPSASSIKLDYDDAAAIWMCIFARARLSFAHATPSAPEVRTDGQLELIRARHPLIDRQDRRAHLACASARDFDTLIITGPNTGGKTVTLKTIGLLTLMAECGLHIPADDGSAINVLRAGFR